MRYRLFTRTQESGKTLEFFHAALTAQAATAKLGGLAEELVRDLFISRMKKTAIQDTLTFETFAPDEVLKRAIKFDQKQTNNTRVPEIGSRKLEWMTILWVSNQTKLRAKNGSWK